MYPTLHRKDTDGSYMNYNQGLKWEKYPKGTNVSI